MTPQAQAALVRLGADREFAPAAALLAALTGIQVSEPTARRQTYAAGAVLLAQHAAAAPALAPPADPGPATPQRLQVSADGAMIPLVGGSWVEVRNLVIGVVEQQPQPDGSTQPHATHLSYFSRLASAAEFTRQAVVETHRRGVRAAAAVGGVMDGAPWLQGFLDYHRPDAVRILDQPHGLDHLHELAVALWGAGALALAWWQAQKKVLLEEGPAAVLTEIAALAAQAHDPASYAAHREYLEARREQLAYPAFRAAGWPVGSGIVESGNKLVVERRLKGAGMRWAPEHVNPLLTLRNAECSGRWAEAWAEVARGRQEQVRARQAAQRWARGATSVGRAAGAVGASAAAPAARAEPVDVVVVAAVTALLTAAPPVVSGSAVPGAERRRPAANHPWRHAPIGKACADPPYPRPNAKL